MFPWHIFLWIPKDWYAIGFTKGDQRRAVGFTKKEWDSYVSFFERQMAARQEFNYDETWEVVSARDPERE